MSGAFAFTNSVGDDTLLSANKQGMEKKVYTQLEKKQKPIKTKNKYSSSKLKQCDGPKLPFLGNSKCSTLEKIAVNLKKSKVPILNQGFESIPDYIAYGLGKIFPIFEVGLSYGETWQGLSESDLTETIADTSFHIGAGVPIYLTKQGNLELLAFLNFSSYSIQGNGYNVSPVLDLMFSSKPLLKNFGLYAGIGVGLGYSNMNIPRYTNATKWTLDFYTGITLNAGNSMSLRVGPMLRHLSHSFVGPYKPPGTNVGYNEIMLNLSLRFSPIKPPEEK